MRIGVKTDSTLSHKYFWRNQGGCDWISQKIHNSVVKINQYLSYPRYYLYNWSHYSSRWDSVNGKKCVLYTDIWGGRNAQLLKAEAKAAAAKFFPFSFFPSLYRLSLFKFEGFYEIMISRWRKLLDKTKDIHYNCKALVVGFGHAYIMLFAIQFWRKSTSIMVNLRINLAITFDIIFASRVATLRAYFAVSDV